MNSRCCDQSLGFMYQTFCLIWYDAEVEPSDFAVLDTTGAPAPSFSGFQHDAA